MQQHLEDQSTEVEKLKKHLQKAFEDTNEIRNCMKKNELLTERWNSRFSDHCKRVNAIVEIAKEERISIYDDV